MPPCPPSSTDCSFSDESATKPSSTVPLKLARFPSKAQVIPCTFAWELNLLSATVVVAILKILPEVYHVYMYALLALVAVDAARYYRLRGSMAGVPYTLPMVSLISMIAHPVRFWRDQGEIACQSPEGLSTNTLLGNFMVFVTNPTFCRQIMTTQEHFSLYAHPNALWLFGSNNLIYKKYDIHKRFRAILTPALFSNDALTMYARAQEQVCREFLAKLATECQNTGKPVDVRIAFRSMAAAASQESFLGPYLTDDLRTNLEEDILILTLGFLSFPFPYLGTGLAKAIQAKKRIESSVMNIIPVARERAASGQVPRCLLDHWALAMLEAATEQGVAPTDLNGCSDHDVATTVMDFLFAAQDATNSALTFAVDVLATRPDVVNSIRAEVAACQSMTETIWSLIRDTNQLQYTGRAANQLLHHKPPVPMVPHIADVDTTLGGHPIRKGTIVIPSIAYSARTSGSSLVFEPDRTADADTQFVKTPVFGAGQHKCPGRRYAESLLTVFLAVFVGGYDWERVGPRPGVNEIMYYPTLFPSVNDFIITQRSEKG